MSAAMVASEAYLQQLSVAEGLAWNREMLAEMVVESSPHGIAVLHGPDFRYELVNPAYEAMTPGREFLGRSVADVWHGAADRLLPVLRRVRETGLTLSVDRVPLETLRLPGLPPEQAYFSFSLAPLGRKMDRVVVLVGKSTRDVRFRVEQEPPLVNPAIVGADPVREGAEDLPAVSESEEGMERLQEYVDLVSHDLRSPLCAVLGHAEVIGRVVDTSPGMARRSAEAICASARHMNAMIQDLLDVALAECKQLRPHKGPVDLRRLLSELMPSLAIEEPVERLRVEVPGDLPLVSADRDHLERILTNLVVNALKYSEGDVRVRAERRGGTVTVTVIDHGRGIPRDELPLIFGKFYRAKGAAKSKGVGLGLYITKQLVEAGGGEIWAESEVGMGSRFVFTLAAYHRAPGAARTGGSRRHSHAGLSRDRVPTEVERC